MNLDPLLLDVLACPADDHGALAVDDAADELVCTVCLRAYPDATVDELDGLTLHLADGAWFNLRASNTEPLLRLNVEAPDAQRMAALRDEVLAIVRG